MYSFFDSLIEKPVIAAVTKLESLDKAIDSPCKNIFLLTGNIFNLKEIAHRVQSKEKCIYICVDLIDGFSKDTWGLEYIVKKIRPDGIITAKENLVKLSKDLGAFTILRLYIMDSKSLDAGLESIKSTRPNAVEILPGIMPKIIDMIAEHAKVPIIASGLITDEEDVINVLNSGAIAISSSNEDILNL